MPLGPRSQHLLDQYLAYALEVYARLEPFHERLVDAGYSEKRADQAVSDMADRLLGPVEDFTKAAAKTEEEIERMVARRWEAMEEERQG